MRTWFLKELQVIFTNATGRCLFVNLNITSETHKLSKIYKNSVQGSAHT